MFLDTCHSGTGLKDLLPGQKARFLPPPTRRGMQRLAAKSDPKGYQELVKSTPAATRAVLFAGCKADQTSADAYFDGRYSGAFTYYFLNLHHRHFLKELDFTPEELRFLLRLSADLKAAKYGGSGSAPGREERGAHLRRSACITARIVRARAGGVCARRMAGAAARPMAAPN